MRLRQTTFGANSIFLSEIDDIFSKVNGGKMDAIMHHDYAKDSMEDQKLRDAYAEMIKIQKSSGLNYRRNT